MARGLLLGLLLSAVFLGPTSHAAPCTDVECPPCGPSYCIDVQAARAAKAQKKAAAIASGLPERLAKAFDEIADCVGCVRQTPDWPHIIVEMDPDGWQRVENRPPPYTWRSSPWTREEEQRARDMMRAGLVKSIHITLARYPCRCCPTVASDRSGFYPTSESYWQERPGWNEHLNIHEKAVVWEANGPQELGPDPEDLTNISEQDKRPPVDLEICGQGPAPVAREIHISCEACRDLKEQHDRLYRWIVDAEIRLRARRRGVCILNQVISGVWREIEAVSGLASTPATNAKEQELMEELATRHEDLERDQREIARLEGEIRDMESRRQALVAAVIECEKNMCRVPEPAEQQVALANPGDADCTGPSCDPECVGSACQPEPCAGPACDAADACTGPACDAADACTGSECDAADACTGLACDAAGHVGGQACPTCGEGAADDPLEALIREAIDDLPSLRSPTHVMLGSDGAFPVDLRQALWQGLPFGGRIDGSFLVPATGAPASGTGLFVVTGVPVAGAGGFRVAENTSPMPRDRVFIQYDYFANAQSACPGAPARVLGFEKTFLDGAPGVEIRLPFQPLEPVDLDFGDCQIVLRHLLESGGEVGGPIVKDRLWFWGPIPPEQPVPYDPALAERMLDEAGWRNLSSLLDPAPSYVPLLGGAVAAPGVQDFGGEIEAEVPAASVGPRIPGGGDGLLDGGPWMYVESLGGSTGEVFQVTIVNPTPEPLSLHGFVALEPVAVSPKDAQKLAEQVRRAPGAHVTVKAAGYCLDFHKQVPPAGTVLRLAGAEKQQKLEPLSRVLDAARELRDAGALTPDTDPASYFHAIRQWAVWTVQERFDRRAFLDAFVEHTRKSFAGAGETWSDDVAKAVRQYGEGRWEAIEKVLETAGAR